MYTRPAAPGSIGAVLDDAIKLYRASFRAWLIPAVIGSALVSLAGARIQLHAPAVSPDASPTSLRSIIGLSVPWTSLLTLQLAQLWLWFAVLGPILRVGRGEWPSTGATLKASVTVLPWALLGSVVGLIGITLGCVLLIVPGVYLAGRWLYWSVALLDAPGARLDAFNRSAELSEGYWWRGVTVFAVVVIVVFVLATMLTFLADLVSEAIDADLVMQTLITQTLAGIGNVVLFAATPAALVATYFDVQLRREGSDIATRLDKLTTS